MAHGTASGRRALDISLLGETIEDRADVAATIINNMLAQYDDGKVQTGARTFQADIFTMIAEATLSEQLYMDVGKVGVHPDNRDRCP